MLNAWSRPTPNSHTVHIAREELRRECRLIPIKIGAGARFASR